MKHIGNKFKYESERDKELVKTFHSVLMASENENLNTILERTVNSPCSRFWLSEERAAIVLAKMFNGDNINYMSQTKQEMYYELFRRALERRKKFPARSVYDIAIDVTGQQAPKFYLTPQSAKTIICKIKKKWKNARKK